MSLSLGAEVSSRLCSQIETHLTYSTYAHVHVILIFIQHTRHVRWRAHGWGCGVASGRDVAVSIGGSRCLWRGSTGKSARRGSWCNGQPWTPTAASNLRT